MAIGVALVGNERRHQGRRWLELHIVIVATVAAASGVVAGG